MTLHKKKLTNKQPFLTLVFKCIKTTISKTFCQVLEHSETFSYFRLNILSVELMRYNPFSMKQSSKGLSNKSNAIALESRCNIGRLWFISTPAIWIIKSTKNVVGNRKTKNEVFEIKKTKEVRRLTFYSSPFYEKLQETFTITEIKSERTSKKFKL